MAKHEKRKGGGGKLTRSETVTVRLDPKLRYLAELAARLHHRTLSSYIEWAVMNSLGEVAMRTSSTNNQTGESIKNQSEKLWALDEADRFLALMEHYPELLNFDEQQIQSCLLKSVAVGKTRMGNGVVSFMDADGDNVKPNKQLIRDCWEEIKRFVAGEIGDDELRSEMLAKDCGTQGMAVFSISDESMTILKNNGITFKHEDRSLEGE